ncbi:MAG: YceI family protein, partial [Hyphomicrobiaceae bacterium]|nr:YceI family protein [Hyphomicrobiaceae bacterium]
MLRFILAGIAAVAVASQVQAATFVFDRSHTEVRASWDHLGLSRQSARFNDVSGRLEFDPAQPEAAKADVTIKVQSLMTGVPALDNHLTKTKDYFDAAAHPTITFRSSAVRMTGDKSAEMSGDLTINGITKPVSLAVVWNYLGPHPLGTVNPTLKDTTVAGFSARTQILRSEWGIVRTIPLISDEIRISIE